MSEGLCAVCGCCVSGSRLFCHWHWNKIPEPLQRTITRLRNNGLPLAGLEEAVRSAVEQVEASLAERERKRA